MGGATSWLARRWLAARWLGVLPVALIVAASATGMMVALSASSRTSNAYTDYVDRADVGDVVINPAFATTEIADVIAGLPGVQRVTTSALFTVSLEASGPIQRPPPDVIDAVDDTTAFVLGSTDGRYVDMDRPVVQAGRMATGPSEAVVTPESSEALGIEIGDVVPMSFWQFGVEYGLRDDELDEFYNRTVAPVGVEQLTVVGIVTLADEALPEQLYPRLRIVVSPDVAAKYDCVPDEPPPGLTLAETATLLLADEACAVAQHYFSIELAGGADGVAPALDQYIRLAAERSEALVAGISDMSDFPGQEPAYALIPTETSNDVERFDDAVRPTAASLLVMAAVIAVIGVALVGLTTWRELQRTASDQLQWHQLGVSRAIRVWVVLLPLASAIVLGLIVSVPAAWLLDVGPQGLATTIEPDAPRRLLGRSLLALVVLAIVLLVVAVGLAVASARGADRPRRRPSSRSTGALPMRWAPPVVSHGVRNAVRRRAATPVVLGVALAFASFVAALTFGAGLSRLLDTPASFGWPWDVAGVANAGYGPLDLERASQVLDDDPDVEAWTYYGFASSVSLDGEAMSALIDPGVESRASVVVVDGELPSRADEVALGITTAADRGLGVGDEVEIGGDVSPPRTATVTAIVVMPTFGPFGSDRVSAGVGMMLPFSLLEAAGLEWMAAFYAFVGVDVADGPGHTAAVQRLADELGTLGIDGAVGNAYVEPVRPVEIIDAADTRAMPRAFGIGFAVVAVLGLAFAAWASVRWRRRELAVLQTLGFVPAQVRRVVLVESIATTLVASLIGVPVGVVIGRVLWRAFADRLGIVPDPVTPWWTMVTVVVGGVLVACVVAVIPARVASASKPAEGLRIE